MSEPTTLLPINKPAAFAISAELEGFPIVITLEGKAEALRAMVERLRALGATPPTVRVAAEVTDPPSPPQCPRHHVTMKQSRQPGQWYCTKKKRDGAYCEETA